MVGSGGLRQCCAIHCTLEYQSANHTAVVLSLHGDVRRSKRIPQRGAWTMDTCRSTPF